MAHSVVMSPQLKREDVGREKQRDWNHGGHMSVSDVREGSSKDVSPIICCSSCRERSKAAARGSVSAPNIINFFSFIQKSNFFAPKTRSLRFEHALSLLESLTLPPYSVAAKTVRPSRERSSHENCRNGFSCPRAAGIDT
mmetsp:Transcript_5076/g.10708  ORF Transcript_5076/g.10708 Transcript_5076/m.10708 type:complete len:140 (+) Transcript_5076:772-1191(+)